MSRQVRTSSTADLPDNPFERGIHLSVGKGGQVDFIEAHKWFNIAAAHGDREAAQHRDELAREMTRQDVVAALRAAREWMTRH
jgi:TPR repeat protein